ncbi:phosphatase [Salipaludibacillus keqinensis]|uniref:Phosphatase n=1 Tax=Salipaludibacillus keqinensis TaxID=2045207 RepID=A0A323TAU4_9BACI|nr:Cof-type HAD-IIB family hydrolase [Salipaludibacillus keqinensis]PYZ91654.1 phosphatase [Salipaludibacillus keqinensis]
MSKKLIFFDIDGTLLDHDKELPASTEEAIGTLQEAGHYVAIATGRAPFMYKQLRERLGISTFVSFNGQYVVLDGEPILKNPLNKEELKRLTEHAIGHDHPVVFMDHRDMKANIPFHPHIEKSIGSLKFDHPAFDPSYLEGREIYQSLLFCTSEEQPPYEKEFAQFDFIRWHKFSTDILPVGGSKAKGIEAIMEKLNMNREDVYVFGDGPNDLEMLQCTPNSVAMGNAMPEVKKVAGFVTKDVDDNGIVHGLKHMGLL